MAKPKILIPNNAKILWPKFFPLVSHLTVGLALTSSQSPRSPRIAAADNASNLDYTIVGEILGHFTSELSAQNEASEAADVHAGENGHPEQTSSTTSKADRVNDDDSKSTKRSIVQRDSEGKLRRFDDKGQLYHLEYPEFEGKHLKALNNEQVCATMEDDLSQRLSLTPTQANSDSLYAQFDIQKTMRDHYVLNTQDGVADDESGDNQTQNGQESVIWKQHQSAVTDSTAYTYRENDTGHVTLDFAAAAENHETDENISQDASFAPRLHGLSNEPSYEPQTPAPPVNPFSQKGSVMKGHEMFSATQPSSIGRHIASPTSSRPSPDVYRNSSPQKRIATSPLERRGEEMSYLQSSVRTILRTKSTSPPQVETPQMTSSRPFNSRRINRREPRNTYTSSKESQERRQKASSPDMDSDTDFDSDIGAVQKRQRQRERNEKIQRELARVTRPGSGSSGVVEVPSTGRRRRSVEEDYIEQCERSDARDTQQEEDVIIDSQAIVEEPEAVDLVGVTDASRLGPSEAEAEPAASRESMDMPSPKSSPELPTRRTSIEPQRVPDLYPNSPTEEPSSPPKEPGSPIQQPSLPLQEVFTNRNDLRTPMASKTQVMSDGADTTIPNTILETSPLGEDRIRPMGEVTSLSFTENTYDGVIEDAPGFTQDADFENAIKPRKSHSPPARSQARDRDFPSFEQPATAAEAPNAASDSHVPVALSSEARINGTDWNEIAEELEEQTEGSVQDVDNPKEGEMMVPEGTQDDAPVKAIDGPEEQDKDVAEIAYSDEDGLDEPQMLPDRGSRAIKNPPKEPATKRSGLRSKEELKGPSKALRRSEETSTPKSSADKVKSFRITKSVSTTKSTSIRSSKRIPDDSSVLSTPLSSLASTPAPSTRSSTRKNIATALSVEDATPVLAAKAPKCKSTTQARPTKEKTPVPVQTRASRCSTLQAQEIGEHTQASAPPTRSSKRKPDTLDYEEPVTIRSSKRQSISHTTRESSDGPLAHSASTLNGISRTKKPSNLFRKMAFAVSYKEQDGKSEVSELITEQGGRILEDGFEKLFDTAPLSKSRTQAGDEGGELVLTATAKSVGFAALIADEHSRKAKYMQALALGLPCISGKWIMTCVAKGEVVDWTPYLLCAGQSSFLDNAIRSRTLTPYLATEANFSDVFSSRKKLLDGKSILLVTAKGKEETRKAYVFLTHILGPARVGQVVDNEQARKKLLEDDTWDLLYVDKNEAAAEAAVFTSVIRTSFGSKKRKRGPIATDENAGPEPKKIRVISDEVVIQSLILGQLLED